MHELGAVGGDAGQSVAVLVPPVYDILWSVVAFGVPALLLAAVVVVALRGTRTRPDGLSSTALAARRHAAVVHALAWLVAVVALPVIGYAMVPGVHDVMVAYAEAVGARRALAGGVLVALTPAGVGLSFLLVHAAGELSWPRPTGPVRRATLRPRSAAELSPRVLRRVVRVWAATLLVTLVTCGAFADADGRSVSRVVATGSTTHSPFPGWFYGVPLLVAIALVLLGQSAVLRLVARRPAVMDAAPEWDLDLRRLSAHRVLRGTQLVMGATAGAVLLVAGLAVRGLAQPIGVSATGSTAHLVGGVLMVVAGLAALVIAVALTLLQAAPASAGTAAEHLAAR